MLFLIFEKVMFKRIRSGFLGYVSLLFWYLKKEWVKNCVKFFRICKYALFNIWERSKQKISSGFLGFVSILFLIFEEGMSEKIASGFLGLVSRPFLNIWRRDEQKNCVRFFRICKCAFFNYLKNGMRKKIVSGFLGFVSMLFLNIWKRNGQKIWPRFYRICKCAFLIFEKGMGKKLRQDF